ncbi:MAG: SMC-Scp complex subunit ScpB [Thermoplasmataceae archaeon]
MNLSARIEAVLYASNNPLSINDIASVLGEDPQSVSKELRSLIREYSRRDGALHISRSGITYKLELRKEFLQVVAPVSKKEFDRLDLEILGFVAANEGCIRGDILRRYGDKAKSRLENLRDRGFLSVKKYRNTGIYKVTREFYRYFNITPEKLKESIMKNGGEAAE